MSGEPSTELVAPRMGSGQMFDRIARRYDFVNRVLSFGIDKSWRRRTVKRLQLGERPRVRRASVPEEQLDAWRHPPSA